ncbi:MAG: phosphoglucomutase (alpha-D-glucose-1,6-bisphosphate-dependent) [Bryobacteraceae bacterium]
MALHAMAGKSATADMLIDPARLVKDYYEKKPDVANPLQLVSFGTSGHRGTPSDATFTETHILAITQAICEYRAAQGIDGPLYLGKDSHAASSAAEKTALEVLLANGVDAVVQENDGVTPTPVISRAILVYNHGRTSGHADGVVITPSHNPPQDGGFKYNPPHGGPADTDATGWIQGRANELMKDGNRGVKRAASGKANVQDLILPYVRDLGAVIDFDAIRAAKVRIGVDPLGGASLPYWEHVAAVHGVDITVTNPKLDATFGFMTVDHDGKIRMDCSSPYAMAGLVGLKDKFDIAFGNDPDADRHGVVTPSSGLMNPNHYLAVAVDYLLSHRPGWSEDAAVGKTLVSSGILDRVVASRGRRLYEVPVGFKWFAKGLHDGSICFGGEESAGASFLRRDGTAWSTDKDGLILGLLAAEITAVTGSDPGVYYAKLTEQFGRSFYTRIDSPATPEQKARLGKLDPESIAAMELAGDRIELKATKAPGNGASIGGLKVATQNGWFAARPSGTENICKLYAESYVSEQHLARILEDAKVMVG